MSEIIFRYKKIPDFLNGQTGLVRGERTRKNLLLKKKLRDLLYKDKSSEIFLIKK